MNKISLNILSEMNRACAEIRTRTETLRQSHRHKADYNNEKMIEEIEVRIKELGNYVNELKK